MVVKDIRKLYVSKILSEAEGVPTYDKMRYIPNLREITVKPNMEKGEHYSEGRLEESDTLFSKVDVSIDVSDVKPEDYMFITGAKPAEGGGYLDGAYDEAPYIAIHYEKVLSNGVMEFATLFKGKLAKPEDKVKTSEGKPEYQTKQLEGTFQSLDDNNKNWRHVVRSTDTGYVKETHATTWGDGKTFAVPAIKSGI